MPVCERYEVPLPMKMAQFNMPLHVQAPGNDYIMEDHFHNNGMTSPHDLGPWMEDQTDGGGKFRLKRRRRCGQCGPCQVKENCGKCQYCVRKDVLKQACIYRKCVYLRKPVPRFRPESAQSNNSNCSGGGGGGGGSSGDASGVGMAGTAGGGVGGFVVGGSEANGSGSTASKTSPQKPSTPSAMTSQLTAQSQPTPSPYNPVVLPAAAAAAAAQPSELSSCQLAAQNRFGLPVNNGVVEPVSGGSVDQHGNSLYDTTAMLDPTRTSYLPGARMVDSGRSPVLDSGRNTNTADSGFGTGSSMTTSPASSVTKDRPAMPPMPPVEQYRPPMEQWGTMPYGFSHPNPWTHPAFQPSPAAHYGFQPNPNHYASPFGPSCRLGMPDPSAHLTSPPQPPFHHNMPFTQPDFPAHSTFQAPAPSMQPTMTPPFYPPPPHIPSSLPNFPSFSQLPSSAGRHASFPMAHAPMYPGNFYPSFRPPTEPQIYHAHLPSPNIPFMQPDRFPPGFPYFLEKTSAFDKGDGSRDCEEDEEDMRKKFSIFRIPNCKRTVCDFMKSDSLPLCLTKSTASPLFTQGELTESMSQMKDSSRMLLKTVPDVGIDDDLQQQIRRISGWGECDVISIDDFKMHAFIRSDGFNNLEIEIESPVMEDVPRDAQCLPDSYSSCDPTRSAVYHQSVWEDLNNNSICERERSVCNRESESATDNENHQGGDIHDKRDGLGDPLWQNGKESQLQEGDTLDSSLPNQTLHSSQNVTQTGSLFIDHSPSSSLVEEEESVCRTQMSEVVVCLIQAGEGGEVTEVEVPGTQVHLQEVCLNEELLATSSNPQELLQFIAQQRAPASSSPDLVFHFEFDRDPADELDPDDLS